MSKKKRTPSKLRIIPLGGIAEIGKNMTVFEYENDMIVVDCGLAFPREDMPGIDYVIPDTSYLEANAGKLRAFIYTHGHEDHIGASQYVIPKFGVPVYGTRLTLALIDAKLAEHNCTADFVCIKPGDTIKCGCFQIEFIKVNHSIGDAVALAIHTPVGIIVHTGDFKIDLTPTDNKIIDLGKFAQLGNEGVLALMSDSTNADTPGSTMSESTIGDAFNDYFSKAKGRIIVASFASNIYRIQQIIDYAKKYNRKICVVGRSMVKITEIARDLGYIKYKDKDIVSIDDLCDVSDNKIVIITTGSQGEPMSGLVRFASSDNGKLFIKKGDLVIISASTISGNEKYIGDVVNMLYKNGATVINSGNANVHVSGHACREELKMMISLTKPKYFIPVHGEYRHLYSHAELAESSGISAKNIIIPQIGMPMEFSKKAYNYGEGVPSGSILVDGLGIGDVGNTILKERRMLSSDGLFIVLATISKDTCTLISEPDIISRGFVYMRESEDLLDEAKQLVIEAIMECSQGNAAERKALKAKIKRKMTSYLYTKTKRSPMIIPLIVEV